MTEYNHDHLDQADDVFHYDEALSEYYIVVSKDEGVTIRQRLMYCPICGEKLPNSFRNLWFDKLESMGINPMTDKIPEDFRSSKWRLNIST